MHEYIPLSHKFSMIKAAFQHNWVWQGGGSNLIPDTKHRSKEYNFNLIHSSIVAA
ncbi:predicted protein [Histoplasma mississippiense (nom. inval.)]|uniref:predicted protein n=1 Tax=Ajellomyces capsulatus (strain NAm1 / WU24) TaxID=2059318 RepID=UPI000157BF26|nr:predicted protein [Histoplasma mississippiense (nom. inval.)]EDN06764.1 predicted protein [Histoplasma mississippiense (nom. inval.)]